MSATERRGRRTWAWPVTGLAVLCIVMAIFLPRALHRAHLYDTGYAVVAYLVAVVPTLVAAALLIELGRRRSAGASAETLATLSLLAVPIAVVAGLIGATMFGVS